MTTYSGGASPGGRAPRTDGAGRVASTRVAITNAIGALIGRSRAGSTPVAGALAVATVTRSQQVVSRRVASRSGAAGIAGPVAWGQQLSAIRTPVRVQRIARWLEAVSANASSGATSAARSQRVPRAIAIPTRVERRPGFVKLAGARQRRTGYDGAAMSDLAPSPLPALIVGAGPAGLATAACLKQRGVEALVLEAGPALGHAWRHHYDRLRLHTVKQRSHLPGLSFDAGLPRYPTRADLVAYLDAYAARFAIVPRTDEPVRRVRAVDGGFLVESARGSYQARAVVVAAGFNRVPNPARMPDQDRFGGVLIHSAGYRNGDRFAGQRVLVIGAGNTGAELALDLAERGAKPTLAVRAPVNVVPRDFLGLPIQVTSIRMRNAPLKLADGIGRLVSRLAFGDLTRYGLPRPAVGPISAVKQRRRIPLIDVGTIAAIKRGAIAVKPGVARLTGTGAVFADDSVADFEAVILATGFRPALAEFVDVPGALDEAGDPCNWQGGDGPCRNLFFVGYEIVPTGHLREIAIQAQAVAAAIAGPAASAA